MAGLVHPKDRIRLLNTKYATCGSPRVGKFFATNIPNDRDLTSIIIQANNGWTELIDFTMIKESTEFTRIIAADKETLVSDDYPIPTYNLNNSTIGFHGEVLYEINVKKASQITKDDFLRVYRGKSKEGKIEFAHPDLIEPSVETSHGYIINTKSGFFNLDGIIVCTNDSKYNHILLN
jgi:hypothetical protein